jgi:hypothetical protein
VLLYDGTETLALDDHMIAMPISVFLGRDV